MTSLRRRLRFWVAAWLVFQVASLSALVPRDCCAKHRPATTKEDAKGHAKGHTARGCHENTAASQCPMRAASGTPCPMHRAVDSHAGHDSQPSHADHANHGSHGGAPASGKCSIHVSCSGPMAAFFALLSNYGVLTDSFTMVPDLQATSARVPTRENLIGRLASPDPPPPRA